MARAQADIDRMIEEGLAHYGRGDLDAALASWEQVLGLDAHNDIALGYIDYVRMNYELLISEVSGHGEAPAFPIGDDDPEYLIKTGRDELAAGHAKPRQGAALDGWAIDEEEPGYSRLTVRQLTFEVDPDEHGDLELEPFHAVEPEPITNVSFDSATKEYAGGPPKTEPPSEDSSQEFRLEITPTPGFDIEVAQPTDVRQRDLGFVQPTGVGVKVGARTPGGPGGPGAPAGHGPATPGTLATPGTHTPPTGLPTSIGSGPAMPVSRPGELALHLDTPIDNSHDDPPTIERSADQATADLLASLPGRRGQRPGALDPKAGATREMPPATRLPGVRDIPRTSPGLPTPTVTPAPRAAGTAAPAPGRSTIEGLPPVRTSQIPTLPPLPQLHEMPGGRETHEFDAPTERKAYLPSPRPGAPGAPGSPPAGAGAGSGAGDARVPGLPTPGGRSDLAPLMTAPTRDLGLRPGHAADRVEDDDEPTGPGDVRPPPPAIPRHPTPPSTPEITRSDVMLPFDPIDARSAQILAAVDQGGPAAPPAEESRDDKTRRRIMALFEHAGSCTRAGELDRAVAAIDLALSEDPNSALAQKLIHRNRDTIMNVFQSFLGDLQRTPILARPLHELATAPINPRAAFLLSRVDGLLSIDEILDVSGMPRLEAYRYLCQLFLRGILR